MNMWCLAVVAAVVSAVAVVQGQVVSYDGTTTVNDDAQPAVVFQAPSSAPVPASAFGQSFTFVPAPAFVPVQPAIQPVIAVQQPTLLPPPQPSFIHATGSAGPQFGALPVLPTCPSTHSLVHFAYGGSLYHFSWCHYQSGQRFTHQQAVDYCRSLNNGVHQSLQFDVLRTDDLAEVTLIDNLLTYYAQASVWTRDTSSTVPYSIRRIIIRSGASFPGHDCLSVERTHGGALLALLHENLCSDLKMVVCEARY